MVTAPVSLRHPDAPAPAVTTVCLLPPADPSAGSGCVVAAGAHDGIVRTWDVSVDTRKGKAKVQGDHRMFVGHEGAVSLFFYSRMGSKIDVVFLFTGDLRRGWTRRRSLRVMRPRQDRARVEPRRGVHRRRFTFQGGRQEAQEVLQAAQGRRRR